MTDLRAFLGDDRYDEVIEKAARVLSERWNSMHTNESLGRQRMLAGFTIAAVLDLLAAAWDEGYVASATDDVSGATTPNPYRQDSEWTEAGA